MAAASVPGTAGPPGGRHGRGARRRRGGLRRAVRRGPPHARAPQGRGAPRRDGLHLPAAGAVHRPRGGPAVGPCPGGRGPELPGGRCRTAPDDGPVGQIARYAWDDHYAHLKTGLKAVAALLKEHGWRARVLADDNAMVDRAAAHRAGHRVVGQERQPAAARASAAGTCWAASSPMRPWRCRADPSRIAAVRCTRCLDGCPTGAITAPGVVDARRCLSWLLQAEGPFPAELPGRARRSHLRL